MNFSRYLMCFLLLCAPMQAQNFQPELEPVAKGYRMEVAQLGDARNLLISAATEAYTKLLEAAEAEATSKGDVTSLGIVTKELEAVASRSALYSEPKGLPAKLQMGRRTYVKASEKAEADFVIGAKKLSTSYLVALGQLQTKAKWNAELMEQIASEKKRLIAGPPGVVLDARTGMEGTVWRTISKPEDKFIFKNGMMNKSWKFSTPDAETIVIRWDEGSTKTLKLHKNGRFLVNDGKIDKYLDVAASEAIK